MKISRNSWHYRLLRHYNEDAFFTEDHRRELASHHLPHRWEPKGVCGYFWSVVGASLIYLMFGLVCVLLSPLLLFLIPMLWVSEKADTARERRLQAESEAFQQTGILSAYLQARRMKICPPIEYEDKLRAHQRKGSP